MRKIYFVFYALFACQLAPAFSQAIIKSPSKEKAIEIANLGITATVNAFSAVTVMNIDLYNPNPRVMDGEFKFSLNEEQAVTGFALDINGHMREGVIVEKQKARIAYENIIRRRVDPGLLEATEGNNYRIRVYPMPANGKRQISVTIQQILNPSNGLLTYTFPLPEIKSVPRINIHIKTLGKPVTTSGLLEKLSFHKNKEGYQLEETLKNKTVGGELSLSLPLELHSTPFIQQTANETYFATWLKPDNQKERKTELNDAVVLWDVSSSAMKKDHEKEITFLLNYVDRFHLKKITIATFSYTRHSEITFLKRRNWQREIRNYLRSLNYDGGTQLGTIDASRYQADEILLFSDGLSNFGSNKLKYGDAPIHCIYSSTSSNTSMLKYIASGSGGQCINLTQLSIEKGIDQISKKEARVLKTEYGNNISNLVITPFNNEYVLVTGKFEGAADSLRIQFTNDATPAHTLKLQRASRQTSTFIKELSIQSQFKVLLSSPLADVNELKNFGKENGYVTSQTSLIVLDNIQDYIQYGILPPKDLASQYKELIRNQSPGARKKNPAEEEVRSLKSAILLYNERIRWWDKNEPLIDIKFVDKKPATDHSQNRRLENAGDAQSLNPQQDFLKSSNSDLQEVVVVGYGTQRRRNATGSVAIISSNELALAQTIPQALEGKIAGVSVIQNNGSPGMTPEIIVRGAGTLNHKEPLYILDGIPMDAATVATLNTSDIQSVEVLKGGAATSIYGSRGTNGVILIHSKKPPVSDAPETPDYILVLQETKREEKYMRYIGLKETYADDPSFYFDVAAHFFEEELKEQALRVLTNLSEMDMENHQLLRAMAYMLESWKDFENAVSVYQRVLAIKEEEPQSYRDLALAHYGHKEYQKALDILYSAVTKDWDQYEARYRGLKAILLNEINNIIALHKKDLNLSKINPAIIKHLPVDLRVVIDWNKDETDIDLHIKEPGGEECYYSNRNTKNGGRLSEDFTQGNGPEEYEVKNARKGTYKISVNYYGDRYQKKKVPTFIKITTIRNFGTADQRIDIQSINMNELSGVVELGSIKF